MRDHLTGLNLPPQLLFMKDVTASKSDLRKAVVNFVGGRADATNAYVDLFDQVDEISKDSRLVNATYAYAQSGAEVKTS
jgi:hypothetical protein